MLPAVISYLVAQRMPGDAAPLCITSRFQVIVPVMPPGLRLTFTIGPPQNAYAAIKYDSTISGDLMPGTVYMEATQGGNMYEVGVVGDEWIRDYMAYYIVFTQADPIYFTLVNTSVLNQRFWGTQWSLLIPTEAEYLEVTKHLRDYSTIHTNDLAREANQILRALAAGVPEAAATPPI